MSTEKGEISYAEPRIAKNYISENKTSVQSVDRTPKDLNEINMYKSIRAKRNIYMNYYIPPPSTFKCKVNSKDFKLCALATYQLSDCNSSIYKIALHVCTCGKHAKNLYLCNWAKYGREAATNMQPNKKNY